MSSSNPQGETVHKNATSDGESHPTVQKQNRPIAEIKVKPRQRFPLLLGNFTSGKSPIGFRFEFTPDPLGTVAAQVVILKTASGNKFVSYLTNTGKKTVSATVWQL